MGAPAWVVAAWGYERIMSNSEYALNILVGKGNTRDRDRKAKHYARTEAPIPRFDTVNKDPSELRQRARRTRRDRPG